MSTPALEVSGLTVTAPSAHVPLARDIKFTVHAGQMAALVGESGSGKTTVGYACLGYARPGTQITSGAVLLGDADLLQFDPRQLTQARRTRVAYVPQSAGVSLNPALRLRTQLSLLSQSSGDAETRARLMRVLDEVALPATEEFLERYPHQLSGGQQQRLVIAAALLCEPEFIVLDEPTTGLDVTTQAQILETIQRVMASHQTACLLISHDLSVVADICSNVTVMYAGEVVESGLVPEVLGAPQHPYTQGLVNAVPDLDGRRAIQAIPVGMTGRGGLGGCPFAPRCLNAQQRCNAELPELTMVASSDGKPAQERMVRCFFPLGEGTSRRPAPVDGGARSRQADPAETPHLQVRDLSARYGKTTVLNEVSLSVAQGECLGVVGESGSGKSTLCRSIVGLHDHVGGEVYLQGDRLDPVAKKRTLEQRRRIQYVFQNPYDSLNPRRTVEQNIRQPIDVLGRSSEVRKFGVGELLELVGLDPALARHYPGTLSGGQRQRVAIARSLAVRPEVLLCDEITSALDVSIQASIIALLQRLQEEFGLTLVFVTHNIALVRHIADSIVVMQHGDVVELGSTAAVLGEPTNSYTRALVHAVPDLWRSLDSLQLEAPDGQRRRAHADSRNFQSRSSRDGW